MIEKLKAWASSAGSLCLAELTNTAVKRGVVVALAAIAVKRGLDRVDAGVYAEAAVGLVMVLLSRAPGKDQS